MDGVREEVVGAHAVIRSLGPPRELCRSVPPSDTRVTLAVSGAPLSHSADNTATPPSLSSHSFIGLVASA